MQNSKSQAQGLRRPAQWSRKVCAVVPLLLDWFTRNARNLPWRRTLDPYAIWVSEIMLQQTQVKTVIPYWERWMRELPSVRALADCKPERVLKLWEGLGYYTRARNLQKAAQAVVKEHNGRFPESYEAVWALPGIGRYTAGAICSIAFDQTTPVLDGNVIRVLTRLFGITADPREKAPNGQLWQLAGMLVERAKTRRPWPIPLSTGSLRLSGPCSAFNQSLMELGALVCTAKQPQCRECPLHSHCVAFREERINELPNLGLRTKPTARRFFAFAIEHNGRWLVRQRPEGVVNALLWEFPNTEVQNGTAKADEVFDELFGTRPLGLTRVGVIKHSITRYRISLEAFGVRLRLQPSRLPKGSCWLKLDAIEPLAFASAHRKLLDLLRTA